MTFDLKEIAEAEAFLADPDAEDCERFASRYGCTLIDTARDHIALRAAATALIDQVERGGLTDDLGHRFTMNIHFIALRTMVMGDAAPAPLATPPAPPERREYRLSEADFKRLLEASKPVPYMVAGGTEPMSPREAAMRVWREIADREGFDVDSVQQVQGKGDGFFTAMFRSPSPTTGADQ